jgi:hypothetical protein
MAVQHIVLFRFPEPFSDTDAKEMRDMISDWPERIGGFRRLRLGSDLNEGARTRGFQYLLHTEHDDVPALRAYQQHPVHQMFFRWVVDHECEVIAFDYEITPDTCIQPE